MARHGVIIRYVPKKIARLSAACLVVLFVSGTRTTAQRDNDDWGAPVGGAQVRIAISATAPPPLPGELPVLEIQLRNQGTGVVTVSFEAMTSGPIEIDGVWYQQIYAGGNGTNHGVTPGTTTASFLLRTYLNAMFTVDAPHAALDLSAGRHTIRVRTSNSAPFSIADAASDKLVLTSNMLVIDIPQLSAESEQRILAERTSAGGVEGQRAADRLIARYPDAAVPALVQAVGATSDAGLRAFYIERAGTLPGDRPVAFLTSQLAPGVDLLSQVAAAEALLARGRLEWVPALVDDWRRLQQRALQRLSITDQEAAAGLIALLVRSREPRTIDALADDSTAPVDIRLAVVYTLLPPDTKPGVHGTATSGRSIAISADHVASLPTGEAGRAIERLLSRALGDTAARVGLSLTYDGTTHADPRVCDMAAFVMARRWPERYHFTWPTDVIERDAQIAAIRTALGAPPLNRQPSR